jgi:hypothetical protein
VGVEDGATLLVELERLRGAVSTGFAEVNGRLDGMAQRTTGTEEDVKELQSRVSALEKRVWMAAGVAAVLSGGGAAGILAVLGQ